MSLQGRLHILPLPPKTGSICGVKASSHRHRIQDGESLKIAGKVGGSMDVENRGQVGPSRGQFGLLLKHPKQT